MTIYIILFVIVVIFANLIEKNKNNIISIICAIILLLVLSIVAGVRTIDMGWDASKYVVSTFFRLNYFNGVLEPFLKEATVETGFSIYSYVLYKIYPDINFLLFGYSFLTTLFIIIFAFREKNNLPISKVLIIYYLTLYLISFNIIRQSISTAMVLVVLSLYKDKKRFKALLLYIITIFFHDSTILALPIFILYTMLSKDNNNNSKVLKGIIISTFVVFICIMYENLAGIAYHIGVIPEKYYSYILEYDRIDYNLSNIFINFYWLAFGLMFIKNKNNLEKFNELIFNVLILFIALIINIVSIKIHPIYRMGYYYYYLGLFNFVPILNKYIKKDNTNAKLGNIAVFGALGVMFLWMTVIGNGHNIYPYKSEIIKWLK